MKRALVLCGAVLLVGACRSVAGDGGGEGGSWRPVLRAAGVTDGRVLDAFDAVSRADFLLPSEKPHQWEDRPLDIGYGQTTSQPSLLGLTLQAAEARPGCKALEVGSGCGYQVALLSRLCREVYGIEIVEPLAQRSMATLKRLGVTNAFVRAGDGYQGWPEKAPFDVIIVSAGAAKVPQPLLDQLAPGGRMVIPVGPLHDLDLKLVTKRADGTLRDEVLLPVRFVPLTGPSAEQDRKR
ncbi:MAG: protein-L-isoaspartate O-methyltransferase [Myxococcota bacterium]